METALNGKFKREARMNYYKTNFFPGSDFYPATLVDVLRWRARHQPDRLAYRFLTDGESEEVSITYKELDKQARETGARLQSMGKTGDRALLL